MTADYDEGARRVIQEIKEKQERRKIAIKNKNN